MLFCKDDIIWSIDNTYNVEEFKRFIGVENYCSPVIGSIAFGTACGELSAIGSEDAILASETIPFL